MRRVAVLTLLLSVSVAVPSFAQRITASIRGTVTDSTGGIVPGANVTVKSEEYRLQPIHRHQQCRVVLVRRAADRHLHRRSVARRIQVVDSQGHHAQRRGRAFRGRAARARRALENVTVEVPSGLHPDRRRRSGGPRHRRAGSRAAAQRTQLPAARHADAGRQPGRRLQHEGPRTDVRHRALRQRQRPWRQHVDGRWRQQQ